MRQANSFIENKIARDKRKSEIDACSHWIHKGNFRNAQCFDKDDCWKEDQSKSCYDSPSNQEEKIVGEAFEAFGF